MKKRAKICLYIFLVCAFSALGIVGYFILGKNHDNVMIAPRFFTFVQVEGAESYTLTASKEKNSINNKSVNCRVTKQNTEKENQYTFSNVVTDSSGHKLVEENYTQSVTEVNKVDNTIDCKIYDYKLVIFNLDGTQKTAYECPEKFLDDVDENIVCCLVSEYFGSLFDEDGTYYIVFVAIDAGGNTIESTKKECEYDYLAVYENEFNKRDKFYMNGYWCDYIITDYKDLELFVWHSILYRENNVRFFIKSKDIHAGNLNNYVIDSINNYPDYDGIINRKDNTYAKFEKQIGTLTNFEYYLTNDHLDTYKDVYPKYVSSPFTRMQAMSELRTKDKTFTQNYIRAEVSQTDRTLNIDESSKPEVKVYNTEQLFMVAQYGAKPIFEDENCVASKVYKNAKQILLNVNNSNTLTSYEKAYNIYRYICENVTYDHVSLAYMELTNNYSVEKFGNLSCFYLEGALYNLSSQYAVCDGLSKTYTLLCAIEGINSAKINGGIVRDGEIFGHAWNRVKLTDSKYNLNGWYAVDTTWGLATYDNWDKEFATNTYFLRLGTEERVIDFDPVTDKLKESNYYENSTYTFNNNTNNFDIESREELVDIFNYIKNSVTESSSKSFSTEFKLNYDGAPTDIGITLTTSESSNYEEYFSWLEEAGVDLQTNVYYYEVFYMNNIVLVKASLKNPLIPSWHK